MTSQHRRIVPLLAVVMLVPLFCAAPHSVHAQVPGTDAPLPQSDDATETATAMVETLAAYGRWMDSPQYGRVWIPAAAADPHWRPYSAGQWIYTDEYGWYWQSDEEFGWIVYHYGRWLPDSNYGWVWIPDTVWGPAWVAWRQGDDFVGWSPLPPDNSGYDIEAIPDPWIFVATSAFVRPDIRSYSLPRRELAERFRRSRFEDRARRRNGIGHNSGIDPGIIAGATGRPLRPYDVQPRTLPSTRWRTDRPHDVIHERRTGSIPPVRTTPRIEGDSHQPYGRPTIEPRRNFHTNGGAPAADTVPVAPTTPSPRINPLPQRREMPTAPRINQQALQRPAAPQVQQHPPIAQPTTPRPELPRQMPVAPATPRIQPSQPPAAPRIVPLNQQRPASHQPRSNRMEEHR